MPGSSTFLLEHYELQMISVFSLDNGYQEQGAWLSEQPWAGHHLRQWEDPQGVCIVHTAAVYV